MTCFLCQSPASVDTAVERPPAWRPLQGACPRHAQLARLPDGRMLVDVVRASKDPLDGPALGFLFNPVLVDQTRCWTSWLMGSWAVHPEIFASADYFEFEVQHRPEALDVLYAVHQHRARFSSPVSPHEVMQFMLHDLADKAGNDALQRIWSMWWRGQRYAEALRATGKPCPGAAQAIALMRELEPIEMPFEEAPRAISALVAIGRRRFG